MVSMSMNSERDEEREEEFYIDIVNEAVSYSFQILSGRSLSILIRGDNFGQFIF